MKGTKYRKEVQLETEALVVRQTVKLIPDRTILLEKLLLIHIHGIT